MRTVLLGLIAVLTAALPALAQVDSSGARYLQVLEEVGADSSAAVTLSSDCGTYQFASSPVLTLEHVKEAAIQQHGIDGGYFIFLQLTAAGSEHLQRETDRLVGHRVGVILSGQLMAAPIIQVPFSRQFQLNPDALPLAQASELAQDLNARIKTLDRN